MTYAADCGDVQDYRMIKLTNVVMTNLFMSRNMLFKSFFVYIHFGTKWALKFIHRFTFLLYSSFVAIYTPFTY